MESQNSPRGKLLLVDDNENNLLLLETMLSIDSYQCVTATAGQIAIDIITKNPKDYDAVLLDIMMPVMDGFEVARILKGSEKTKHIPIIFLTAKKKDYQDIADGLGLGADEYLTKPINQTELIARVHSVIRSKKLRDQLEDMNRVLEQKVIERTAEIERTRDAAIFGLAKLAEYRDPETGMHLERIRAYTRDLSIQLMNYEKFKRFINNNFVERIYKSSILHDIGKVGIPDSVLLKPGKLDEEEFEIMKQHSVIGGHALNTAEKEYHGKLTFLTMGKIIAYFHHEKWDGSGYPRGLAGYSIPPSARIMAVADVYDALVSRRVYKAPAKHSEARDIILAGSGTHFDPDIVKAFTEIDEKFLETRKHFAEPEDKL